MSFWIFIGESSGMPLDVQKCDFSPTTRPGVGSWVEFIEKPSKATQVCICGTRDGTKGPPIPTCSVHPELAAPAHEDNK